MVGADIRAVVLEVVVTQLSRRIRACPRATDAVQHHPPGGAPLGGRAGEPDWMALARGRSGPIVRNLIGPEQQCKALEDIAHLVRSHNADAVNEPRAIDGSDLGDVYDTRTLKSCFTPP